MRLLATQCRFCRRLAPGIVLFGALLVNALAQNIGSGIVVPAATVAGIGLASAANYQVASDAQWKDYEDVLILSVLNGANKAAANAGQPLTATAYTGMANQLRTWLDSKIPQNPVFADETACLRYAIDALMPLLNSHPDPSLQAALAGLENLKLTQLESPINITRQYPADMGFSSLSVNEYQFIGDRVQEASDLAQNDPEYATTISPILMDFLTLDTTATYAQIQSAYPNAVPALPSPNADGSFALNPQDILSQYQTVIGGVQSAIDSTLSSIEGGGTGGPSTGPPVSTNAVPARSSAVSGSTQPGCPTKQIAIGSDQCDPNGSLANNAQGTITGISKLISLGIPPWATRSPRSAGP